MKTSSQKINYGIDAPGLVKTFFILGLSAALAVIISITFFSSLGSLIISLLGTLVSAYCLGMGSFMVFYSSFVKIKDREKLLDLVPWAGTEASLDVGCGRGLMLVGAARRMTTGKAVGIDLWLLQDQSDNNADAPLLNAKLEGVEKKVEVMTSDMRKLPFHNHSFDVVTSSWAVHNLESKEDRTKALDEMLRVLKPHGKLILADIANQDEYEEHFRLRGLTAIKRENYVAGLGLLRIVSFGSFAPSATLATKN